MPLDHEDHVPGLLQVRRTSAPLPAISQDEAAAPLPDYVSHNIEAIRMLHIRADENLSRYHRPIETVSALLGRPAFFYSIVLCVMLWVLLNLLAPLWAIPPFDPPPYFWLQGLVGLGALLTTTMVLITPTATLLEHTLLTQGFMEVQKAAFSCCLQPQNRDALIGFRGLRLHHCPKTATHF